MDLIYSKTGIRSRHIAAADECASDLGVAAAEKLFATHDIDRGSIDFLLFCTQTPDYPLPTTACLMQHRLGLPTTVGALDFNLGCSGFVYGLSLADGLIRGGMARRILLITAETYSKYIDPADRSLRTIFGDAGAATLIEASDVPSLSAFAFGTDGSAADALLGELRRRQAAGNRLATAHPNALGQQTLHGRPGTDHADAGHDSADGPARAGRRKGRPGTTSTCSCSIRPRSSCSIACARK